MLRTIEKKKGEGDLFYEMHMFFEFGFDKTLNGFHPQVF